MSYKDITLKEKSGRTVTLIYSDPSEKPVYTVQLLGTLQHGTKIEITQELVDALQQLVNSQK